MKLNKIFTFILVLVLMLICVSINTLAEENVDYLDLESTETYKDNKDLDQNYTFTQTGDVTYTDTTKVKLTWTINDIEATYTSHKTWDPTNLQWTDTKEAINVTHNGAEFTLTNYSSEGIIANVDFKVEESLKDTFDKVTYTNNNCAVKTPVTKDNNTYQDSDFTALNKTITSEITFNKDKFADLSDTTNTTKYGTYTVTIKGPQYLTFTANKANSTVTPNFLSGIYQYSTDNGKNWTDGTNDGTTTIILSKVGDNVILRGIDCQTGEDAQGNPICFSMTESIAASGDVTSLTNGIGGNEALTDKCYEYMFVMCESLTTAPALPSETLAENCYAGMFAMCTSLTTASTLPATTLANNCYGGMFAMCTSLKIAPALPATTLAPYCYYNMFSGCEALITAPALPATTLASDCYVNMFSYCTALITAPALPATSLAFYCYYNMFLGCTSLTTAPELLATTLVDYCYLSMFSGCTALTTAPELSATNLTCLCYSSMFEGCSSLKITSNLATAQNGSSYGIITSGNKTVYINSQDQKVSSYNMFKDCIKSDINDTPDLTQNVIYYWYIE